MSFHLVSTLVLAALGLVYLFLYLDRRQRHREQESYNRGYESAKQSLLKGYFTRNQLSELAIYPGRTMSSYDRGILKAISDYTHDKWKIEEIEKVKNGKFENKL